MAQYNRDVMEEFRRNGRDVDLPEDVVPSEVSKDSTHALPTNPWTPLLPVNIRLCAFCKANGETAIFYQGHCLKDEYGRVVCPVLSKYTCPVCGATGASAHTVKYCPFRPVPLNCIKTKVWERNAVGRVVPAKKFLPLFQ